MTTPRRPSPSRSAATEVAEGVEPRAGEAVGVSRQGTKWLRRQQEIYDVAAHVFHEKGYEQTSMDDIAEAVGLLKGSLYHYITSKEDLLHGIAQVVHRRMADEMQTDEHVGGTALDRLCARFHRQTLAAAEDEDFLVLVAIYYHEFASLTQEHQQEVLHARRAYEADTRDRIALAQADGSVCPALDAGVIGPAVLTLLNSVLRSPPPHDGDWDGLIGTYVTFIRQGLSCPPSHDHGAGAGATRRGLSEAARGPTRRR
jgi:AcrR family transcriptional regulator